MILRRQRRVACASLLLAAAFAWSAGSVDRDVAYLLEAVAGSGCSFIRNGTEHTAREAADHLRLKYARGRRYVDSAEAFIDRLATGSSWTGRAYSVRCGEQEQSSAEWLHRILAEHRESGSGDESP